METLRVVPPADAIGEEELRDGGIVQIALDCGVGDIARLGT
jgi:hypothetical protein